MARAGAHASSHKIVPNTFMPCRLDERWRDGSGLVLGAKAPTLLAKPISIEMILCERGKRALFDITCPVQITTDLGLQPLGHEYSNEVTTGKDTAVDTRSTVASPVQRSKFGRTHRTKGQFRTSHGTSTHLAQTLTRPQFRAHHSLRVSFNALVAALWSPFWLGSASEVRSLTHNYDTSRPSFHSCGEAGKTPMCLPQL